MANELVAQWSLGDVFREQSVGYQAYARAVLVGDACGLRLNKKDSEGYILRALIPAALTMATGLTFGFELTVPDTPDFTSDPGKVVRLGFTVKRIISGESLDMDVVAGTEQTVDVTLQATAGLVTAGTLAIAVANLDAAAVGNRIMVRLRRIGSHANDTCQGSVVLTALDVVNT